MTTSVKWPLLIFDLDGTLIDSAVDIQKAMNVMLKRYDRKQVDLPVLISHIGDGLHQLVNDFFPEYKIDSYENKNRVNEFLEVYEQNLVQYTVLYPGVLDFLQTYEGPKALVTNKMIHPTLKIFKHFGLDRLPWVDVIGGDSLAEKKPSAMPLRHVMSKAGYLPSQTWMIGDGRPDMKSALAAGCVKVAVHYGYSTPTELQPFQPDFVLNHFAELTSLTRGLSRV